MMMFDLVYDSYFGYISGISMIGRVCLKGGIRCVSTIGMMSYIGGILMMRSIAGNISIGRGICCIGCTGMISLLGCIGGIGMMSNISSCIIRSIITCDSCRTRITYIFGNCCI